MRLDWSVVWTHRDALLQGALVTVLLTALTMLIAVPGGIVLMLLRQSRFRLLRAIGTSPVDSDRAVVLGYALVGVLLWVGFRMLSPAIELDAADQSTNGGRLGLHRSRATVFKLSGLFGLDAFGGALVAQSLVAYWFTLRYGAQPVLLGVLFFVANALAGLSALVAAGLAKRIGLIRTMVFTHLPGNVLIIALPLMPNLPLAALVLFARFSVNQMDIPARQSYLLAVVDPDERSAAGGVTA